MHMRVPVQRVLQHCVDIDTNERLSKSWSGHTPAVVHEAY